MKEKRYIAAIEIGSSKVVGAVAELTDNGQLFVEHVEVDDKLINSVNYGIVQNVENVKNAISHILRRIETSIGDGARIKQAYVGLAGRSLHSEPGEVNRSIDASETIKQATIGSILRETGKNGFKKYDTLTVVPNAFYVDNNLVADNNPVGLIGNKIQIKYNMIVANPQIKKNLTRVMTIMPGNTDKNYIITTLAMGKHILTDDEKRLGCMLVDMGAETTTVAIYTNGMLNYINTLPLGGRNLTLDIVNGLGNTVLEETAERVKKSIHEPLNHKPTDYVTTDGVNSREAANFINARTGEIIANINKQIEYAALPSGNSIHSIVITGGSAQLKGFDKKLQETTKITVRHANMPYNVNSKDTYFNRPEYVQIMSLLAEAATIHDPYDSCVEIPTYSNDIGPEIVRPEQQEEEPRPEPKKNSRKPEKGPSKLRGWLDKITSSLVGADQDDDELL
ncbi:MAG: pilus assembly protein PilM [Muribaculaceae bacterium]|nr:pilus assembly protein PilM [Muribaculaceae bacterium]